MTSIIRNIAALPCIAFALAFSHGPALAGQGFGALGDTIPFFVNNETTVGTWTQQALNVTGGFTATGNATISGNVTALYYAHTSDLRLKTDVHPVPDALDRILSIRGVEFRWTADGRPDMGVVAQNVGEVFPNVVHMDNRGFLSVEYDSLVAPMIEAIRELKTENDYLLAELKEIRARLNASTENVR